MHGWTGDAAATINTHDRKVDSSRGTAPSHITRRRCHACIGFIDGLRSLVVAVVVAFGCVCSGVAEPLTAQQQLQSYDLPSCCLSTPKPPQAHRFIDPALYRSHPAKLVVSSFQLPLPLLTHRQSQQSCHHHHRIRPAVCYLCTWPCSSCSSSWASYSHKKRRPSSPPPHHQQDQEEELPGHVVGVSCASTRGTEGTSAPAPRPGSADGRASPGADLLQVGRTQT